MTSVSIVEKSKYGLSESSFKSDEIKLHKHLDKARKSVGEVLTTGKELIRTDSLIAFGELFERAIRDVNDLVDSATVTQTSIQSKIEELEKLHKSNPTTEIASQIERLQQVNKLASGLLKPASWLVNGLKSAKVGGSDELDVFAKALGYIVSVWNVPSLGDYIIGSSINDTIYGQSGNDILIGRAGDDILIGRAGDDILIGEVGNDSLYGEAGDDILYGATGDDVLDGGYGNDILIGGDDNDSLGGGTGDDCLDGGDGDDVLYGEAGNDNLYGGSGNDIYKFAQGFGNDDIISTACDNGQGDIIEFGEGISAKDIRLSQYGDNLVLSTLDGNNSINISNYFYYRKKGKNTVTKIKFADNKVLDISKDRELVDIIKDTSIVNYVNDIASVTNIGLGVDNDYFQFKTSYGSNLMKSDNGMAVSSSIDSELVVEDKEKNILCAVL